MADITLTASTSAPPAVVWEVLTRSADWADWADFSNSIRERDGVDHPDGVGSIRKVWVAGLIPTREEVVTFDPDAGRYGYTLLSGPPVKDYQAAVSIDADGSGTRLTWNSTFRPALPLPGADHLSGLGFKLILGRLLKALTAEAERRS